MAELLFKVNTSKNKEMSDDEFVEHCMGKLMAKYPEISSYMYERVDEEVIHILLWGNFEVKPT